MGHNWPETDACGPAEARSADHGRSVRVDSRRAVLDLEGNLEFWVLRMGAKKFYGARDHHKRSLDIPRLELIHTGDDVQFQSHCRMQYIIVVSGAKLVYTSLPFIFTTQWVPKGGAAGGPCIRLSLKLAVLPCQCNRPVFPGFAEWPTCRVAMLPGRVVG